jgi:hypothetical protein
MRGDQEILVLPVGEVLDGQRQAFPEVPVGYRALSPTPGDERGHAVDQQCGPAFAQEGVDQPGNIGGVGAQLGQRVVPLAEPVPQHRR